MNGDIGVSIISYYTIKTKSRPLSWKYNEHNACIYIYITGMICGKTPFCVYIYR